jgi:hypothetical protein
MPEISYALVLQSIASLTGIATSTSMLIAYRQLRLATRNTQVTFEDALAREFRQVSMRMPLKALLGQPLDADEMEASLAAFYWYFDLTNEQLFLRRHGRISETVWRSWEEGIERAMRRPAFADAWRRITAGSDTTFAELRAFLVERRIVIEPGAAASSSPANGAEGRDRVSAA